jgi:DNA replication protein DnaC
MVVCGQIFTFRPTVCDACAAAGEADAQPKQASRWERLCPKLYQCTNVGRLKEDLRRKACETRWIQEVLDWQHGSRGLVLSGPTGVGKSRVIRQLLRRLLDEEHRTGVVLNAVMFRSGLQSAACESATEEFVRHLVRAEVLYFDDLGQMQLTGAASETLLHVVEERTCGEMPILTTTQYSGEELDIQFDRSEMGQAIRRRLNEFCRVVKVREMGEQDESARFGAAKGKTIR